MLPVLCVLCDLVLLAVAVAMVVVVCGCVRCRGVCVVWYGKRKKHPCVDSKRHRVYIQNVPVCTGTARTCRNTCARVAGLHGDVLNAHTEAFWTDTRRRGGPSSVLHAKKCPRRVLACPREVHQRKPCIVPILSLSIGRTRHVPESSNHSLYLLKLFNASSPEGTFGWNQL